MKISKRDCKLLLILTGLLGFFAMYMLLYLPYQEKIAETEDQISQLGPRLAELEEQYRQLPTIEADTDAYRRAVSNKLDNFPCGIENEDFLAYLLEVEKTQGLALESVSFDAPTLLLEFPALYTKNGADTAVTMQAYRTGVLATGQLNYPQLKNVINHLYDTPQQTVLDSVGVSYNAETGSLSANFSISKFFLLWDNSVYQPSPLPQVDLGLPDLFATT